MINIDPKRRSTGQAHRFMDPTPSDTATADPISRHLQCLYHMVQEDPRRSFQSMSPVVSVLAGWSKGAAPGDSGGPLVFQVRAATFLSGGNFFWKVCNILRKWALRKAWHEIYYQERYIRRPLRGFTIWPSIKKKKSTLENMYCQHNTRMHSLSDACKSSLRFFFWHVVCVS